MNYVPLILLTELAFFVLCLMAQYVPAPGVLVSPVPDNFRSALRSAFFTFIGTHILVCGGVIFIAAFSWAIELAGLSS